MRSKMLRISLFLLAVIVCYPLFFLISGTFMEQEELQEHLAVILNAENDGYAGWPLIPHHLSWAALKELLLFQPGFFRLFWNTVFITGGVLIGQLLVATPAAWVFSAYDFRGKRILFSVYLLFLILPFQALMLSEYVYMGKLGLLNTIWAIILPGVFSTFPVFIEYTFFRQISSQILDAARVDGANEWQVFLHIGLPVGSPGIIAAMVLQFFVCWNMLDQPAAFLQDEIKWPMALYLPTITLDNAPLAFASTTVSMVPAVLLLWLGQPFLEEGIGALSGKE